MTAAELDPRWEWAEVRTIDSLTPRYVKVACRHLEKVPVDLVTGEVVAQLCLTCDGQLPPPRLPGPL